METTATVPSGTDAASAATPGVLCAPSKIVSGSRVDDLEAARDVRVGGGARDGGVVERPGEERLGGGERGGEVDALVARDGGGGKSGGGRRSGPRP